MATQADIVERRERFEEGIKKWQEMEDQTIASADKIKAATDNILVQTLADIIRDDSAKHKEVLGTISQALDGTIVLEPEDLGHISELITNHIELERSSINLAVEEYENSRNFVIRELLSYLLEDERKHFKLLTQLNDFKRKLYPYA